MHFSPALYRGQGRGNAATSCPQSFGADERWAGVRLCIFTTRACRRRDSDDGTRRMCERRQIKFTHETSFFFTPSGRNEFAQTRFASESIYIRTLRTAITMTRARTPPPVYTSKQCVLSTGFRRAPHGDGRNRTRPRFRFRRVLISPDETGRGRQQGPSGSPAGPERVPPTRPVPRSADENRTGRAEHCLLYVYTGCSSVTRAGNYRV